MTKILKSALVALLVTFCCAMKAETIEYTQGDFTYSLNTENQEASLNRYSGDATEIVIPEFVTYEGNNYKVTSLGSECFFYCSSLTSVVSEIEEPFSLKCDVRYKITPIRKLYLYKKALFCGDSVTKGFVVEGTQENPNSLYEGTNSEWSYPSRFHDMFPSIDVDVIAVSRITATGWKNSYLSSTQFENYDLIVFELGLNGYLSMNDINTEGTNTNDYRKIIQGARAKNPDATIVLVASSHFTNGWVPILNIFAEESNCLVIDLKDTTILNLDNQVYHGYTINNGQTIVDWAHFTRKGYVAKAYVFSRMLENLLTDETYYPSTCTLIVPYGKKDAYIAAGWTEDIFGGGIVEATTVLDENSEKMPIAEADVKVCVKRSINADEWSTIVLPFDMTEEQVKEAFGDDVQLADFAGYETIGDAGEVTCIQVNFNAATSVSANRPCLIKVGMDINEFTVEGVDVVPKEKPLVEAVSSTESQWSKMAGSYIVGTQVEKNCLFLSGNKFWYSTGETWMAGYRAYFDFSDVLSSMENAEAKVRLAINGDGTTTGVESVEFGVRKEDGCWYSLDGHRLTGKPTEKGIYIVNGKKVAID